MQKGKKLVQLLPFRIFRTSLPQDRKGDIDEIEIFVLIKTDEKVLDSNLAGWNF